MDAAYRYLSSVLIQRDLGNYCHLIRMHSIDAVMLFQDQSIDCLYIDGNFSISGSRQDVEAYFPKVKDGGYIWLDRADLRTKSRTLVYLMTHSEWIQEKSMQTHCLLFRKRI